MSRPRPLPLLLILTACASAPLSPGFDGKTCVTPCGLRAVGLTDQVTCDELARYEAATVQVLSPLLNDPKRWPLCTKLGGFQLQVLETHGTNAWTDDWGRNVAGLTFCDGYIQVGTDTWTISSLAHEAIHTWDCPAEDLNHEAPIWQTDYKDQINKVYQAQ